MLPTSYILLGVARKAPILMVLKLNFFYLKGRAREPCERSPACSFRTCRTRDLIAS